MPKSVDIPDIGRVQFGDDMSEQAIGLAVKKIVKDNNSSKGIGQQISEGAQQLWDDLPGVWEGIKTQGKVLQEAFGGSGGLPFPTGQALQHGSESSKMARGIANDVKDEAGQVKEAWKQGDMTSAAGHAIGAIPLVGKPILQVGEDVGEGNYGKAGAHALELLAPEILHKTLPKSKRIGPLVRDVRNATEKGAIESVRPNVKTSVGQRTGNAGIQRIEKQLVNLPGSSHRAHDFFHEQESQLAAEGKRRFEKAGGYKTNSVGAGKAVDTRMRDRLSKLKSQADRMYGKVRTAVAQKQVPVQTGTRNTGILGPSGQPINIPVMSVLEAPVDLQPVRNGLTRIHSDLVEQMPEVKRLNSPAFKALDNLMQSDKTHMSAMDFDQFLGALKSISREGKSPYLTSQAQALARRMINEGENGLNKALLSAGPDAVRNLRSGRNIVKSYYETSEILSDLHSEPARIYEELSSRGDVKDTLLGKMQLFAPHEMELVGRTYLEQMLDKATREGGFSRSAGVMADWNKLGEEAKSKFYGKPVSDRIDKFLLATKKMTNPLGPGTAHFVSALGAAGGLAVAALGAAMGHFTGAVETVGTAVAIPHIAVRLLMTEEGARLMTQAISLPVNTPAWRASFTALSAKVTSEIEARQNEREQENKPENP